MSKKIFIISLALVIFIVSCATFDPSLFKKKPTAQIEKVDIASISLRDITLVFDVKISNPYPLGINLSKVSSRFIIEKKQLFDTSTKDELKIPANNSAVNPITVNLKYQDIIDIVKDYSKKDELDCTVEGDIVLAVPKTGIPGVPESYTFPYKVNKTIPTIKPVISIKDFKIEKPSSEEIIAAVKNSSKNLSFTTALQVINDLLSGNFDKAFSKVGPEDLDLFFGVNFKIELKNNTKTKINFNEFNYDFFLNTDKMITGKTTDITTKDNTSTLNIQNKISLKTFSKSITMALKSKKGDFHLKGETAIKLPDTIKKEPLKLLFDEKGSVEIGTK
ncbi:MAG: LEA type 2 family protein [Spirochaetes bacterium]|nr:LEA type 2 family protein [Spirochaetota bacterium]